MEDTSSAIANLYFTLQDNLGDMLGACQTKADHDAVLAKYNAAAASYWACMGKSFHDDDPEVQALAAEAGTIADDISAMSGHLDNISKVLGYLTEAVTVSAKIAAKVATL